MRLPENNVQGVVVALWYCDDTVGMVVPGSSFDSLLLIVYLLFSLVFSPGVLM